MKTAQRILGSALLTLLMVASVACAGSAPEIRSEPPPSPVTVTLTPSSATVFVGPSQQFTAQVSNSSNQAVTWQVNGVTGGTPTWVRSPQAASTRLRPR